MEILLDDTEKKKKLIKLWGLAIALISVLPVGLVCAVTDSLYDW